MLYVMLFLFVALGLLVPVWASKIDQKCKEYFIECLENDIYYPDPQYFTQYEDDEEVIRDTAKMIEIAGKYMKNPEIDRECIKKYQLGFEVYKNENLDDLLKYLEERHERKMEDPEYREAYIQYQKYNDKDITTKVFAQFNKVKNTKPKKSTFLKNIDRIRNR